MGKILDLRTETGYEADSLDDLAKQREVQVAKNDEAVNPEVTREESNHTARSRQPFYRRKNEPKLPKKCWKCLVYWDFSVLLLLKSFYQNSGLDRLTLTLGLKLDGAV